MNNTEIQIKAANAELREIMKWFVKEKESVADKLKKAGKLKALDGQREAYRPVCEEFSRRIKILFEKYPDIPNDAKITLR